MDGQKLNELSRCVIGAAFQVSNVLGCHFKEKVYENAMCHELRKQGLNVEQQVSLQVFYDGVVVGDFIADLLVEGTLLVELKTSDAIIPQHESQAINYLSASGLPLCLILNFGTPRVGIKRMRL